MRKQITRTQGKYEKRIVRSVIPRFDQKWIIYGDETIHPGGES